LLQKFLGRYKKITVNWLHYTLKAKLLMT
jgi:hypothetical protein